MGYSNDYKAVVKALWRKLLEISDFSEADRAFFNPWETVLNDADELPSGKIVFGERQDAGDIQSPEVWIRPRPDTIDPARTMNSQMHNYEFWITTMLKHENLTTGLYASIELGGKVYDKLMEDRTLDGTLADLKITEFEPEYMAIAQNSILHWTNLVVTCRRPRHG